MLHLLSIFGFLKLFHVFTLTPQNKFLGLVFLGK